MATRAKFQIRSRQEDCYGTHSLNLLAVSNGSKENDEFFKLTPSGEITLSMLSAETAAQFTPGKHVYVDFTIAE